MSHAALLSALAAAGVVVAGFELAALVLARGRLRTRAALRIRPVRLQRVTGAGRSLAQGARAAGRLLDTSGVGAPHGLEARLVAAGAGHPGAVAELMALKCALALAAGLVCLAAVIAGLPAASVLIVVLPAGAFVVPDLFIARRARSRARALRAQAPDLLALVRLAAEAGLGTQRALELAAGHGEGLLAAEVRAALSAVALGLPREQAYTRLAARCPVPEVHGLVAALTRSAVHGTPLGPAAMALATRSRAERARRIGERAQRAAPKIQLVVAVMLVPAVMLLIVAGMLAGLR